MQASFAKATEQRKRRQTNHRREDQGAAPSFSRNKLTPGVPFMEQVAPRRLAGRGCVLSCANLWLSAEICGCLLPQLTASLESYAQSRMARGRCLQHCTAVKVSGGRAIGEGEHKMLSAMLVNGQCPKLGGERRGRGRREMSEKRVKT